jgi:hypothetical protein
MLAETGIVLIAVPYRCTAKPNLALQSVSYFVSVRSSLVSRCFSSHPGSNGIIVSQSP